MDEALTVLRARTDTGDPDAARRLAELLAEHGQVEEALTLLGARANAGDRAAAWRLADLLSKQLDLGPDLAGPDLGPGPDLAGGHPA
ncbi:hypothetical protein [Sphaerisporangium album]|uniref:hypothetical protein n=1 Tax=Sphaerisporangium album TaxID=509200 RepID=UPI0011C044CF|nr:hypothetical protein [Sphaerisporangium album]